MTSPISTDDICAVVSIESDDEEPVIVPVDDWDDVIESAAPVPDTDPTPLRKTVTPEELRPLSSNERKLRALLQ